MKPFCHTSHSGECPMTAVCKDRCKHSRMSAEDEARMQHAEYMLSRAERAEARVAELAIRDPRPSEPEANGTYHDRVHKDGKLISAHRLGPPPDHRPNEAAYTGETCGVRSGYAVCYLTRGHTGSHVSPRQEWDQADDRAPRAPDYGAMTDVECCASGYHRRKGEEACACGYKLGNRRADARTDYPTTTALDEEERHG